MTIQHTVKIAFFVLLSPVIAFAAIPKWKVQIEKSSLTFTATQNNAPITGNFKTFDSDIAFDPKHLDQSKVKITVPLSSLSADYSDLVDTLKNTQWFDVKQFPNATFQSTKFTHDKDKQYTVKGNLTIRDKTVPVSLTFNLTEFTDTSAIVEGETTVARLNFGIGQGEWSKTNDIKDDVVVKFRVVASVIK